MPKYLFQATYTADGIKGLEKDKATGREAALKKRRGGSGSARAMVALGGFAASSIRIARRNSSASSIPQVW